MSLLGEGVSKNIFPWCRGPWEGDLKGLRRIYSLNYVRDHIESISKMIQELKQEFPGVNFYVEMDRKGGLGYYVGSCFHIYSKENDYYVPLCDGGRPDWNKQLLQDRKEASVASGIGWELVLNLYK